MMRHAHVAMTTLLLANLVTSAAFGSLIGDAVDWELNVPGFGGSRYGSATVVDPGAEVVETLDSFGATWTADLAADTFDLTYARGGLSGMPATNWIFTDLQPSNRQVITGVTQASGSAVDGIEVTNDSITVRAPETSGNFDAAFDIQFGPTYGLDRDEINWRLQCPAVGGQLDAGSAMVTDRDVEAYYWNSTGLIFQADLTADTLALTYQVGGFSSFPATIWEFTDLDWLSPTASIGRVVQTSGPTADGITITGDAFTVNVPDVPNGTSVLTFDIFPVPEPASLVLLILGGTLLLTRRLGRMSIAHR